MEYLEPVILAIMERILKLLKRKYILCYIMFLVVIMIYLIFHTYGWIYLRYKPRTYTQQFGGKNRHRTSYFNNYEPFCGPHSLDEIISNDRRPENLSSSKSTCALPALSNSGCRNIMTSYYQTVASQHCHAESYKLCRVDDSSETQTPFSLKCNFNGCRVGMNIRVGVLNAVTGILSWHQYTTSNITTKRVLDLATSTLANKNPFMFIECTRDLNSELITQLLMLPYYHYPSPSQNSQNEPGAHPININMVLIDSVSRQHFYRMLPNTVRYLQKLRSTNEPEVLDFELFHSIKGRTYENLKALFEGEVHEVGEEFEDMSTPPTPVDFNALLSKFKRFGYTTLYQEDLCWEHEWGLIKDTGVYKLNLPKHLRFPTFTHALLESSIDSLGMTHSVCEIFRRFHIIDAFNYLGNLCFSRGFIHDYFLDYILQALKAHVDSPLFSFHIMNVAHEGTGKRIRTLDVSLLKFLTSATQYTNTIHILFSDHGNSYGPFSRSLEGHLETFHPFMFMLIPKNIAVQLGKGKMENLRGNQKALISVLDLHFTLKELLNQMNKEDTERVPSNLGLFGHLPVRTCNDLQLRPGALCFCESWRSSPTIVSVHYLIAEFILSKANRKLHKSQQRKYGNSSGHCQRLIGTSISNVWQKIEKEKVFIGLDIRVQDDNVFSTVVSFRVDSPKSFDMKIDAIRRLSSFSTYKVCAHKQVPLELCVCSMDHNNNLIISGIQNFPNSSMFSVITQSRKIHDNCLDIHTRSYTGGAVFEASNACFNVSYSVKLNFKLDNMKLAISTYHKIVSPGSIVHLAIVIMDQSGIPWSYTYTSDISWRRVNKNKQFVHR